MPNVNSATQLTRPFTVWPLTCGVRGFSGLRICINSDLLKPRLQAVVLTASEIPFCSECRDKSSNRFFLWNALLFRGPKMVIMVRPPSLRFIPYRERNAIVPPSWITLVLKRVQSRLGKSLFSVFA